jgi:hypothetical protein
MNENDFIDNYLWLSDDKLDRTFTHPLPDIEGLKKCGDFIVQSEHEGTFSTNIMTKYVSDTLGVRLVEVYKNNQNKVTGTFLRLVGTMVLVKDGYPRVSIDAPIANVNVRTGEREDITTRAYISLNLADDEQKRMFFGYLREQAKAAGISYVETVPETKSDFAGLRWMAEAKGVNLDMIRQLRHYLWNSYKRVLDETKERLPFDYRPWQEYMIFDVSKRENLMFKGMGLTVPVEAQAAFFSVLVSHVF